MARKDLMHLKKRVLDSRLMQIDQIPKPYFLTSYYLMLQKGAAVMAEEGSEEEFEEEVDLDDDFEG